MSIPSPPHKEGVHVSSPLLTTNMAAKNYDSLNKSRKPEQENVENSPNQTLEKSLKRLGLLNNKIALGIMLGFFFSSSFFNAAIIKSRKL